MQNNIKIGNVALGVEDYAITANAVLGIRGAGKTYLAKSIAEQMLGLEIPIVVFDPIGQWRYLRRGANAHTKGFRVVVAGGEEPDLKLTPQTAVEIVRAAIAENIPLVIDLYDRKLSKSDWRRIVRDTFRTLLYENKGVRHIFLEETAEFAPQRVQDGETYAEVEKLVRMGGNASLGITLINQRAQEVNKAVLDLCENLILMRQRGAHAITALEKWLDKVSPDSAAKITADMPEMGTGEAWVFAGSDKPRHTRGNKLRSFHPDRRRPELSKRAGKPADVVNFVARLTEKLSDKSVPETIADRGVSALAVRLKNTELAKENEALRQSAKGFVSIVKKLARQLQQIEGLAKFEGDPLAPLQLRLPEPPKYDSSRVGRQELHEPKVKAPGLTEATLEQALKDISVQVKDRGERLSIKPTTAVFIPRANGHDTPTLLTSTARRCLIAIAQYPEGVGHSQLAALVGYSTRTVANQIGLLRKLGYVNAAWPAIATNYGLAALGDDYERLPQGDQLLQYWLDKLPGTAASVLRVLVARFDIRQGATNAELAEALEFSTRTITNQVGELKRRKLVTRRGGRVVPIAELFDA